jgi:2-polyprenyl-3-methyl-5-hydroxy-6-metoxy-1,4-benzoquinol methylase
MTSTMATPITAEPDRPYLGYYTAHGISPVQQEIAHDLAAHFRRRQALYHCLGIPSGLLAGKNAIEFGPGSGHNALYTASLSLERYTLVDGNPTGVAETQVRLRSRFGDQSGIEIVHSLIESFDSDQRYDLVLCEGVIPFQRDPAAFTRHAARFTTVGGIVVVTCIDSISGLGEFARRLVADRIIPFAAPSAERMAALAPVFTPHLESLSGRTRPVEDWVHDNILIPYHGRLFSIADAINCLADGFDLYASSPRFIADWRWYKTCDEVDPGHNAVGLTSYFSNVVSFADYRLIAPTHDEEIGRQLLHHADRVFALMVEHETNGRAEALPAAAEALLEVVGLLRDRAPAAAEALSGAAKFVLTPGPTDLSRLLPLCSYFGRGQQYLSFVRRASPVS